MEVISYVSLEDCSLFQDMGYHMGLPPSPRTYRDFGDWENVTNSNDTKVGVAPQQSGTSLLPAPELVLQHVHWLSVASLLYQAWCYSKSVKRYATLMLHCVIGVFIYLLIFPVLILFWLFSKFANIVAQIQHGGISLRNRILIRRLDPVDALWVLELPESRSVISAVIKLNGRPNLHRIQQHVAERLKNQEKMNLCFTSTLGYFFWIKKGDTDLKENVKLINVGEVFASEQYEQRVHNVAEFRCNAPMCPKRPPWELVVVDHCRDEMDFGHYYVIVRIHHAVADGISIVQILLNSLLDTPIEVPHMEIKKRDKDKASVSPIDILSLPVHLGKEFKMIDKNELHGDRLSGIKVIGICEPIDLQDVKRIKNATGTTVNDVLTSCITSATANFFREHGGEQPRKVSAVVPIIVRNPKDMRGVANWFSIGVMHLPMEPMAPLHRLSCIQALCKDLKRSLTPFINGWLVQVMMGIIPANISKKLILIDLPNTMVISNVIGPPTTLSLWRHEVLKLWYVTPHRGNVGVSVSILSYAGKIHVTVMVDLALLTGNSQEEIDLLTAGINNELHALMKDIPREKCADSKN